MERMTISKRTTTHNIWTHITMQSHFSRGTTYKLSMQMHFEITVAKIIDRLGMRCDWLVLDNCSLVTINYLWKSIYIQMSKWNDMQNCCDWFLPANLFMLCTVQPTFSLSAALLEHITCSVALLVISLRQCCIIVGKII